jgi:CRP-like cAMP-binding protein
MSPQPWDRNAFLAELSPSDYDLFRPHLTGFKLGRGERLQDFGQSIDHVVFPHDGVVAMTMPVRDGGGGAILVGRDSIVGAVGAAAAAPALCDAEVYIPGGAARMSASAFRRVLDQSPAIRRLTACYTAALMMQVHQTALCNAAHPVERRISRSLLEVLDRGSGFDVHLTQSTLAQMLGVQRTTVNLAAGRLETAGVINCRRAYIQVVRREQLESYACECYRNVKHYMSRLHALPAATVAAPVEAPGPRTGVTAGQERARQPALAPHIAPPTNPQDATRRPHPAARS